MAMRSNKLGLSILNPFAVAALVLNLGACASLGDDPFTLSEVDTGAPEAEVVVVEETATAPADLGGSETADVTIKHPGVVLAVAEDDPFEHLNRAVFHFNDSIDTHLILPVAKAYRAVVPVPARDGIRNAFANVGSPVTWANDVLQGEWGRAHVTFNRFVINSTIGVAGLHDVAASEFGLQAHYEDFDQTLALAGMESGPFLMLPLLGPSSPRHVVGRVVDSFAHPLTWALSGQPLLVRAAPRAVELTSTRADLIEPVEQLKASSPDYYAAVRSYYRQSRANEIGNGMTSSADDEASLEEDLDLNFD